MMNMPLPFMPKPALAGALTSSVTCSQFAAPSRFSRSGSLRGSLDAQTALSERRGVAASSGFDAQNQLGAAFTADIVANRLLLETRASITQQSVSAYGEQGVTGPTLGDRNRIARGPCQPA